MKNTAHYQFWPKRLSKTLTVPESTLFDNLLISAKRYPNKVAFHYYGGSYTYHEVLQHVEHLAGYLEKELLVQKEEKILLFMQNSPQYIISYLAILRVRAVVVPINPMSVTEDLEFFVKDSGIRNAIVGQELLDKVIPLKEQNLLENIILATYSDYIEEKEAVGQLPPEVSAPVIDNSEVVRWNDVMGRLMEPSEYTGESTDIAAI